MTGPSYPKGQFWVAAAAVAARRAACRQSARSRWVRPWGSPSTAKYVVEAVVGSAVAGSGRRVGWSGAVRGVVSVAGRPVRVGSAVLGAVRGASILAVRPVRVGLCQPAAVVVRGVGGGGVVVSITVVAVSIIISSISVVIVCSYRRRCLVCSGFPLSGFCPVPGEDELMLCEWHT